VLFELSRGPIARAGIAWASILAAGALGNFFDALLMPPTIVQSVHRLQYSATLGLLAAYSWRRRSGRSARWPYRWAPLIAAVALLALIGAGGEHTDVLAHLTDSLRARCFGVVYGSLAVPDPVVR